MATFRDLLAATKAQIREVDTAAADELRQQPGAVRARRPRARRVRAGRHPRARCTSPGARSRAQIEGRLPDHDAPIVIHCAGGIRSAFAAKTLQQLGYTDVVSMAGGFNRWKDEGRDWSAPRSLDADQRNRYSRHLLLPEVGEEGQLKLLDAKVLLLGAGGLGSPVRALPGGGRRRHDRHRRHGRRRRLEPAAPDPAQHRAGRDAQGRLGQADARAAQPRREGGDPRRAAVRRQRGRDPLPVRHRRRRRRQLPEPLPAERRGPQDGHARRPRLDLPLRGPGHRVQAPRRPLLPLHDPRAAAAGAGAVVRRGRRARRAARHHRLDPGARDHQGHPRPRRRPVGPPARLRRARGVVPHLQASTAIPSARPARSTPTRSSSPSTTSTAPRTPTERPLLTPTPSPRGRGRLR